MGSTPSRERGWEVNQDLEQKAILAALQIISWSGGDESTSRHAQVITYMERFAKSVLENAKQEQGKAVIAGEAGYEQTNQV